MDNNTMTMATPYEINEALEVKIGDGWIPVTVAASDTRGLLVNGPAGQFRVQREDPGVRRPVAGEVQPTLPGLMSEAEARACVARIRTGAEEMYRLLVELQEREGWRALGYDTWTACLDGEFRESRATLYRALQAGRLAEEMSQFATEELPAATLRQLARVPLEERPAIWREAQAAAQGRVRASDVEAARRRREGNTQEPTPDEPAPPPIEILPPEPAKPPHPPRQEPARSAAPVRLAQPPSPALASGEGEGASRQAAGAEDEPAAEPPEYISVPVCDDLAWFHAKGICLAEALTLARRLIVACEEKGKAAEWGLGLLARPSVK